MGWFSDLFKTGRRGLLPFEAEGGGLLNKGVHYKGMIEAEELEQAHGMSRIRIIKISGAPDSAKQMLPEWIDTDRIKWIDAIPTSTGDRDME